MIGLQETKLRETCTFKIPQYTVYRRQGHHNATDHGGVALLIHKSISHNFLPLRTELQAIAATIYLTRPITVVSIYSSRSHRLTEALMTELSQQLPSPVLLLGDFNSYHDMWGCERTDPRGVIMANTIDSLNLVLLNSGQPTRITLESETAIDLSICSPTLAPQLTWDVLPSSHDSDHNPVIISLVSNQPNNRSVQELRYNFFITPVSHITMVRDCL